jgi:hypothetical protein
MNDKDWQYIVDEFIQVITLVNPLPHTDRTLLTMWVSKAIFIHQCNTTSQIHGIF